MEDGPSKSGELAPKRVSHGNEAVFVFALNAAEQVTGCTVSVPVQGVVAEARKVEKSAGKKRDRRPPLAGRPPAGMDIEPAVAGRQSRLISR